MQTTAFADWYRESHPGLLEAVLRAVGRGALAEEAVDSAFEKAFVRWDRVHAMRSPKGWVYRVAVNEARRQLRIEGRDAELALRGTPSVTPPPGGEAWLLVHELPIRQRTAIVLRHVAGLTEAEIAASMGVARSTVSSTLASAYQRLRQLVAEPVHEENERTMELELAVAVTCDTDGCDVDMVANGSRRVTYSDAVRNTIKVRPGDLVAIDSGAIVWRWWHGTIVSTTGTTAVIKRNVTQEAATDPRTATMDVTVPADLAADLRPGDVVFFGTEDGQKVVVATAAPEVVIDRIAPRLPGIASALD